MSSAAELNQEQLAAARMSAWRQAGEPLLTLEAARGWVNERGLVLFAPLPQLAAAAPSLVEATLGHAKAAPTPSESEAARGLLARLVGEGLALPLNLLGATAQTVDTPDFVVSAQVFSFVFTMRGDKAWKQPPATNGAVKVSPLGLRVYEVLTERGALTAMELASELGREVTETAILRVLHELWGQLRVIPLLSQGVIPLLAQADGRTLWELTTRRFTKAIKAGANAGRPTALSALVSLYLAQVFAAAEEEVVTFLSPLTARSRVREVLHALLGARQLDTVVVEGKTLLYIPGTLPGLATAVAGESAGGEDIAEVAEVPVAEARPKKVGTGRIRSFEGARKPAGEFRGKPARVIGAGARSGGQSGVRFGGGAGHPGARSGPRADGKSDRERRPFRKDAAGAARSDAERPSFAKPWNEEKKARPAREASAAPADSFTKFRRAGAEERKPLGPREQAGLPPERRSGQKPRAERGSFDRASRPGGLAKGPYAPRPGEGGDRPGAKRAFTRGTGEGGEGTGFKPRGYERGGERKGERSPDRGADRGAKPGGFGAKRSYTPRTAEGGDRRAAKPGFHRDAKPGGFGKKRPYKPRAANAGQRPFTKAPWTPREGSEGGAARRPYTPRGEGGAAARKSFGGKPAGKFTKVPGAPGGSGEFGAEKRPYKPRAGAGFGSGAGARKGYTGKSAKFGGKSSGFHGGKRSGRDTGARPTPRQRPEAKERKAEEQG